MSFFKAKHSAEYGDVLIIKARIEDMDVVKVIMNNDERYIEGYVAVGDGVSSAFNYLTEEITDQKFEEFCATMLDASESDEGITSFDPEEDHLH